MCLLEQSRVIDSDTDTVHVGDPLYSHCQGKGADARPLPILFTIICSFVRRLSLGFSLEALAVILKTAHNCIQLHTTAYNCTQPLNSITLT